MDDSTLLKDGYRFLEGLTHADYAFEAIGKNLSELFLHSAKALIAAMADVKTIQAKDTQTFSLENKDIEPLLFEFLEEIIFLKDAESFLPVEITVRITLDEGIYHLESTLKGEEINPAKHRLENDVKAVTYHLFKVEKTPEGYRSQVILDV